MSKIYAVEVQTIGDPEWYGNAKTYETEAEALAAAENLHARWLLVEEHRVVEKEVQ